MRIGRLWVLVAAAGLGAGAIAAEPARDPGRDILVTFDNSQARRFSGGIRAPYRHRQRYSVDGTAQRRASRIADEYGIEEIDRWPIRSLSVYCVVYRADATADRVRLIERLKADARVESVQELQTFTTSAGTVLEYSDTYAGLQHGLQSMSVSAAHRHALGDGVRIVIVDSNADTRHEDMRGRFSRVERFFDRDDVSGSDHGTAVASVIGANANNDIGIVGIAPEARLDLFAACWAGSGGDPAICDSFSLARALDEALSDPPDIVNLSLTGPADALLERLLGALHDAGVITVAAVAADLDADNHFPASVDSVVGVSTSGLGPLLASLDDAVDIERSAIFAPGRQILVAIPDDNYGFRSGSSLAAAHVSGVIALMLSRSPDLDLDTIVDVLRESQKTGSAEVLSVDACAALNLIDSRPSCR